MFEPKNTTDYDEFLFNTTSHLLKPLSGILETCSELFQEPDRVFTGKLQQSVQAISSNGHRLLDLVNDVRDYAEAQTGRIVLEKKPTDLAALLTTTMEVADWLVKSNPQISLQKHIPESLPRVVIHDTRIQQVLVNLIHNAVKYTNAGHVQVSVTPENDQVIFRVDDTGIGIPHDKYEQVFAPFQTAIQDHTDTRIGLGLGLPISKYLVEAHNGKMWFESKEGVGASFYFSLPIESTG